jgi:hypothetical protein
MKRLQRSARAPKYPSPHRNGVRHAAVSVSAITPESCPSRTGIGVLSYT